MHRNLPSSNARAIASRLLTYEASAGKPSDAHLPAVVRVAEKLRRPLSALAGSTGFGVLLGRALTLARAQDRSLEAVRVQSGGFLDGWSELRNNEEGQAGVTLISQLFSLLEAFIGQDLALRLVADVWPDLPAVEAEAGGEGGK
jgi:hypothetical protein